MVFKVQRLLQFIRDDEENLRWDCEQEGLYDDVQCGFIENALEGSDKHLPGEITDDEAKQLFNAGVDAFTIAALREYGQQAFVNGYLERTTRVSDYRDLDRMALIEKRGLGKTLPMIREALSHTDTGIQSVAMSTLAELGDRSSMGTMEYLALSKRSDTRTALGPTVAMNAMFALCKLGDENLVPLMLAGAPQKYECYSVNGMACNTVFEDVNALEWNIEQAVTSDDPDIVNFGLEMLKKHGDRLENAKVLRLVGLAVFKVTPNTSGRSDYAFEIIEKFPDSAELKSFLKRAAMSCYHSTIHMSLLEMEKRSYNDVVAEILPSYTLRDLIYSRPVLAVFPAFEEFIIPRLRAWINDPEMEDTCLRFLYAIGGSSAMELLSKAMESGNPEIRFRAAYILSKRKGSYDIFVEKLKSERPEVKLNALEMSMLDDIEWPSSDKYSAISPVLRDKDEAVRAAALKAMADICTKDGEFCARLIDKNDLAAAAIKK